MKIFICNAFSLSMLDGEVQARRPGDAVYGSPRIPRLCGGDGSTSAAFRWLEAAADDFNAEIVSAVGHADTAALFSALLGREITVNRVSVKLPGGPDSGVFALIGQLQGPRLPEGATTLPEGATIAWWLV